MLNCYAKTTDEKIPDVQSALSYIDSVEIQQNRYFRKDFLSHMKKHCGSFLPPEEFPTYGGRTKQRMWLHQPDVAAIAYLKDKVCTITRVHVSLDLLTETRLAASELQAFLSSRLVLSYRPHDLVEQFVTTTYYGFTKPRGPGQSMAIYSDRMSKLRRDSPCCHVELRIEGAKLLDLLQLHTAAELLALDYRDFWARQIRLVEAKDATAVGALWAKAFRKNVKLKSKSYPFGSRTEAIRRIGNSLLRSSFNKDGEVIANDLIHHLRQTRVFGKNSPQEAFNQLSIDWMLPAQINPR